MRKVIGLWLASVVIVAILTSVFTRAQTGRAGGRIVSGNDIGFRLEGTNPAGEPVGTWVVRIDGQWEPVGAKPSIRRVK